MSIKYIYKDITTVSEGIVAHGVNCQGVMNSGVAKDIRRVWSEVYRQYKITPQNRRILGDVSFIHIDDLLIVANCYTQRFYGRSGKYAEPAAIKKCLRSVMILANLYELDVYMPRIGCGLGGLNWDIEVKPIVETLADKYKHIDIHICDKK